jgi:hypothetical protein
MDIRELIRTAQRLDELTPDQTRRAGAELEAMALEPSAKVSISREERQSLRQLYCSYETLLENEFAQALLAGDDGVCVEDYLLWDRFCRLTRAEVAGTRLKPGERVAFIGSGPFPISALLYAKTRGSSVCCIDSNAEAVKTARRIIARLGFADLITFDCIAGQDADYSRYNVVMIAVLATPKYPILERICKTILPGGRVGCRTVFPNCDIIYEAFEGRFPDGLRPDSLHRSGHDDTISCHFLAAE